jgi:hypothetical protein
MLPHWELNSELEYKGWLPKVILVCLLASFACSATWSDPSLPPSVLVLDQSAPHRTWSTAIIAAVQSSESDKAGRPISYHIEHLDLFGFGKRQPAAHMLE